MTDAIKYWKSLPEYKEQYTIYKHSNAQVIQNSLDMLVLQSEEIEEQIETLKAKQDTLMARRVALCDLKRELKKKEK